MTARSEALAELKAFIERIERIGAERKALGDDQRALFAEAKAQGFDIKSMRRIIKRRDKDPSELAENEAIDDTYAHALGMTADNPLYTSVARMAVDTLARDQVIDALQLLIPTNGEIIARVGGAPMRLWRDETGRAHAAEYAEPKPAPEKTGRALKPSAAVLSMVPKDSVKAAADPAERRAATKKPADEKTPADEPVE